MTLPKFPPKGQRRALDQEWLDALHSQGLAVLLDDVPDAPDLLKRAIAEFNQGKYWQCHETLETIWLPERYPLRLFYHGLIKAAVGLLHLQRSNRHGALVKLRDAESTLAPFSPGFLEIDVASLLRDVGERLKLVEAEPETNWPVIEKLPAVQIQRL